MSQEIGKEVKNRRIVIKCSIQEIIVEFGRQIASPS
jgi:hypothetical protein